MKARQPFSPAQTQLLGFVLAACGLFALFGASLGVSLALAPQRFDLFHASFFSACAMRSYDLHWQHPQRMPQKLSYDFVKSPDSFILLEVWVKDGPTLSFGQRLPQSCR